MPILRQPTNTQPGSNQGFQSSVSSVPVAMSMMIDSMVNMVQNSRPDLKAETDSNQMNIEQFVAQSEGTWRSMRSGHSSLFSNLKKSSVKFKYHELTLPIKRSTT